MAQSAYATPNPSEINPMDQAMLTSTLAYLFQPSLPVFVGSPGPYAIPQFNTAGPCSPLSSTYMDYTTFQPMQVIAPKPPGYNPSLSPLIVIDPPSCISALGDAGRDPAETETSPPVSKESEDKLKAIVVDLMSDKKVNPFQGSVPVEKIQNILRNHHLELYTEVVGMRHRAWNSFLERHSDVFEVFSVDSKYRMRLLVHEDYQIGDEKEKATRDAQDNYLLRALTNHLLDKPDMMCTVDDFIAAYSEQLKQETEDPSEDVCHSVPKRGDLVRFIKRQCHAFSYDSRTFVIRLLPSYLVEALTSLR